ncbi:MAG: bacteriohemerythrin [Bacillota bacterium]
MTINWSQDLKIGVEKIDQQHQAFFQQRDKFMAACTKLLEKKGDSEETRTEIDELFYFLTDYFVTHFDDEEELQQKFDYPDYKQHHKQHQEFIKRVNELKYNFLNQDEVDLELLEELKEQITDWFVNHIAKTDTDLKEYIGAEEAE